MRNDALRAEIKTARLYQYEVAEKLGVTEMTLIRWMRKELPQEKVDAIRRAISEVKGGERA